MALILVVLVTQPRFLLHTFDSSPELEQLFLESSEDLLRYFARRHAETEVARDLVQETFLKMARGMEKGARPRHLRAYLYGVARHVSQAAWTRRGRERNLVREYPVEAVEAHPAEGSSVDDRVEMACAIIATLPDLHREVLDLRFSQGLSYAEIAEVLDIPMGTVRSRLHHAVSKVRERLERAETRDESSNPLSPI